jgi:glycosyltransferase involved in cell wall biosynthesis
MIKTQIVIPCFNESEGLLDLINECRAVIDSSDDSLGFILVDNGSKDGSNLIFSSLQGKYSNIQIVSLAENQGYGGGIIAGLNSSTAQIIGWTHADLQTPLSDCLRSAKMIAGDVGFVKGFRAGRPFSDRVFSRGMGIFESILFASRLEEVNAQPTIFKRNFYEKWQSPPADFSLDLYALVVAVKSGLGIRRIKVHFLPRQFGQSNWNVGLKSKIKFIRRTLKYSFELRRTLHENL